MKIFSNLSAVLAALVIALGAFVAGQLNAPDPVIGAANSSAPTISQTASSSGTYFGKATAADVISTTTLLTVNNAYTYQKIGIEILSVATTTPGTIYAYVESSADFSTWTAWTPSVSGTGALVSSVNIPATSTPIIFSPEPGTDSSQFVLENFVGKHLRVRVWMTGTSTISVKANLLN